MSNAQAMLALRSFNLSNRRPPSSRMQLASWLTVVKLSAATADSESPSFLVAAHTTAAVETRGRAEHMIGRSAKKQSEGVISLCVLTLRLGGRNVGE